MYNTKTSIHYQEHLGKALHEIFPGYKIIQNAKRKGEIRSSDTGRWLELDFLLPELNVAFEFQDPYHYISTGFSNTPLSSIQEKEYIKVTKVTEQGGSLVIVPCWWDGSTESLRETIRIQRPDLVAHQEVKNANPIPPLPKANFFVGKQIPEVGELMQASFSDCYIIFPNIWWISEKYDGIRACWNPQHKKLFSKYSTMLQVKAPYAEFPPDFLDGELWFGRSNFCNAQLISSSSPSSYCDWPNFRYILFDRPCPSAQNEPYEKRIGALVPSVPTNHHFLIFAPLHLCHSRTQLTEMTKMLIDEGGEGTVLRLRGSLYRHGASTELLKFKAHRRDEEAVVINIDANSIVMRMANGVTFSTSDNMCAEPIQVGDVVTFSFTSFSKSGSPIDPVLVKLRTDLTPPESPTRKNTDGVFQLATPRKAHGHWTADSAKNVRSFFDSFLQSRGKDPPLAENWYEVTNDDVTTEEGGYSVLSQYNNSLVSALKNAYPETSFEENLFKSRKAWQVANRRQILDNFAQKRGFEALVADNWYDITGSDISHDQDFASMVKYRYNGSIAKTVMDIYNDLSFDDEKFLSSPRKHWNLQVRKQFFDEFAHANGFDSLVAEHWYPISTEKILATKNGASVMNHYHGSYIKALTDVFPTLHFDQGKFLSKPKHFWEEKGNKKKFFDDFAANKGFEAEEPENWYRITTEEIVERGGQAILNCYSGSAVQALLDVYPNIGLVKAKFSNGTRKTWHFSHRKAHFDLFAARNSFDPLAAENWLSVSLHLLQEDKNIANIVKFCYNSSFRKAISDIYSQV